MTTAKTDSGSIESTWFMTSPVALEIDRKRLNDGVIEGHAVLFGKGDKIRPGAFRDSIRFHASAGTLPVMTWNHDLADVVGRWIEAREDSTGVRLTGRIAINTDRGDRVRQELLQGIDGVAASYEIKSQEGGEVVAAGLFAASLMKETAIPVQASKAAPVFASSIDLERWLRDNGIAKNAAKKIAAGGWQNLQARTAEEDEAAARRLAVLLGNSIQEITFKR